MLIAEVSEKFDINSTTLRYYEKIGLMDPVEKDASGHRNYQEKDLRRINFIKCMRTAGMSIENIKKYVDLFHEGEDTISARKELLVQQHTELKAQMAELQKAIDYLETKIANYEEKIVKKELDMRQQNKDFI